MNVFLRTFLALSLTAAFAFAAEAEPAEGTQAAGAAAVGDSPETENQAIGASVTATPANNISVDSSVNSQQAQASEARIGEAATDSAKAEDILTSVEPGSETPAPSSPAAGQSIDPGIETYAHERQSYEALPGIVPFSEIILFNVFIWAWDRYPLQKNYAKTGPSIWKRNFREGWKWDNNNWGVNFVGHPYQGSYYFVAARSAGYSFYTSMLFTAFGSWSWEFFCETEYPAPNDLVTTTVGGSLYGEMLFRLSQRLFSKPDPTLIDQAGSLVMHPMSFAHWKAFGIRPNSVGYKPISLDVSVGGGYRFGSDYRYDREASDRYDNELREFYGAAEIDLVYGKPNSRVKKPLDYFTFDIFGNLGQEEKMFSIVSSGTLKNYVRSNSDNSWMNLALNLDFDSFYGDIVQMGNLSLGLALDIKAPLTDRITLRYITEPGFIFLGSADFNYDDILSEFIEDYEPTREYQYNYGARYLTSVELEFYDRVRLYNRFIGYVMKTMPNTEPHYGATGYDVVLQNLVNLEYKVTERCSFGIRLDSYVKIAAYTGEYFEPMSRTNNSFGVYNKINVF